MTTKHGEPAHAGHQTKTATNEEPRKTVPPASTASPLKSLADKVKGHAGDKVAVASLTSAAVAADPTNAELVALCKRMNDAKDADSLRKVCDGVED